MSTPRIQFIASLIATILQNGGSIALVRLENDLRRRDPSITVQEFRAAITLGVASGKIMRTFGGAALARAS